MRELGAPVVAFVYNRPAHAQRMLDALCANALADRTDLIVFCDGPRSELDLESVRRTRAIVDGVRGFRSVRAVRRETNLGLARSILSGLDEVSERHDRFIVLEDDLVCSAQFLDYMNDGLERFADDARVGSIHAYMFPIADLPDYFFTCGGNSWGWATWADRWRAFQRDGRTLLRELKRSKRLSEFDRNAGGGYAKMLVDQVRGRNESWAIRWHASLFLSGLLTLQPGRSFVQNIGMDASGTHSHRSAVFDTSLRSDYAGLQIARVQVDASASEAISRYFDEHVIIGGALRRLAARLYVRYHVARAARP